MSARLTPTTTPPNAVRQIEQICDRFEAAWKDGQRPLLEAYLSQVDEHLHSALLRELLPLEWEYRVRAGDQPQPSEYQSRFPAASALLETIGREVAAATSVGGIPTRLGQYRIIRQVGRGGMGVVYEAEHESLGRRVALKVLPKVNIADVTARERFRREAETTARLQHPNIVQIFEVDEHDGQPFLALEYVPGPNLGHHLRKSPQPPQHAAALLETLARAVHYAHEQGIVHRDLKPANVLMARVKKNSGEHAEIESADSSAFEWVPKITDFGLARPMDECGLTATGDIVGTPAYMAPEQAWGKSKRQLVGPASDVYALGAILYEALTGRPVFQGGTALEALEEVRTQEPVPPTRLRPRVPRDLETICLKCLEKEPGKRYASALALAEDLHNFQGGRKIVARRTGPVGLLKRWCRRNASLAVASTLGFIAIVSATALALNYAITVQVRREQKLTQSALEDARFQRSRAEKNAVELTEQQELTKATLVEVERFRRQAERLSASLALERGMALLEQGDVARGMLLLGHSLQITSAEDAELQHVIRSNIAAAYRQLPYHLHAVLEHRGEVWAAAYSPDGKTLLTGGRMSPPRRWDAVTGEQIGDPLPHEGEIKAVAMSPDGTLMVTAGTDKFARIWEVATGKSVGKPLEHPQSVQCVTFSPDGKTILTGSADGIARLWETATGQPSGEFAPTGSIYVVAYSPDGKKILTGASRTAQLWETETKKPLGSPMRHPGNVWTAAFSPDGKTYVTGSEEGNVWSWDSNTVKLVGVPFVHQGPVRSVGYTLDGKTLWSAGAYGKVRFWDANKSAPIRIHSGIYAVAMSRDQSRVATASADGKVRLWEKPVAEPSVLLPHEQMAFCVAISPDGATIVTGAAGVTGRLWNTSTGQPIGNPLNHKASIMRVAFSPDGRTILTGSGDKTAQLWNAADGTPCGPVLTHADEVYAVAFSPDGRTVLTGCKDSTARLWDASTGEPKCDPIKHPGWVHAVAFSPDGKTFATACEDATARFWNATTAEPVGEPLRHRGPVRSLAFSPDGSKLATGTWDDRTARVWNVATGKPIGLPLPHPEHVLSVAFSPDGKTIATGSWDGTARIWDVATGKSLGPPLIHPYTIRDVAFSPDGKTLWTASFDKTVRSWTLPAAITGDAGQINLWIQGLTGMELDSDGLFRELDAATWQQRSQLHLGVRR